MQAAADLLLTQDDFFTFSKAHSDNKTTICKVSEAIWIQKAEHMEFRITADRFLRNMVRAITGTLFDVGRSKITIERFKEIMEAKDRRLCSASAPAQGLFLTDISYPSSFKQPHLAV